MLAESAIAVIVCLVLGYDLNVTKSVASFQFHSISLRMLLRFFCFGSQRVGLYYRFVVLIMMWRISVALRLFRDNTLKFHPGFVAFFV